MTTYIKKLQTEVGIKTNISQFRHMQMAVVRFNYPTNYDALLYSYYTPVGVLVDNTWYLTTKKYSITTSKQMTIFARTISYAVYVDNIYNILNN